MKIGILIWLLSLLPASLANTGSVPDLPPAPDGFSWRKLEEIEAAALVPKGWFFKKEKQKGVLAYFITKENIDIAGKYETGLTIQAFKQPQKTSAEEFARATMSAYYQRGELTDASIIPGGIFSAWKYQAKSKAADGTVTIVKGMIIENTKTKTFYLVVFESSEGKWKEAIKIGGIIQNVALNDGI